MPLLSYESSGIPQGDDEASGRGAQRRRDLPRLRECL